MKPYRRFVVAALAGGLALSACKRGESEEHGAAPPPTPSAKPGVCSNGGGTPTDSASAGFFTRVVGEYCIDPNGDTRAYGEGAKGTLDDVCTEQLDGECEVYKTFGLSRVVTLRYVDGKGSPGAVAVLVSRFASKEGAYAFFTKRIIADADPAKTTVTALDAGAAGAVGSGVAYVYRGEYLAELSYTNEAEPPDRMRESGKRILPEIAKSLGSKLPGDVALPAAVSLLPPEHRIPMGTSYVTKDLLGVTGLGGGAFGFYQDGERRYRVVASVLADEDAANDVLEALRKAAKATTLKELPFPAVSASVKREDGPRTDWVLGRKGNRVFGVGDEELVLGEGLSKDAENRTKLPQSEKVALLKKLAGG